MTGLTLTTDKSEYSRHEPQRSIVRVRAVPEPRTGLNDTVLLALRKKGGPVVATEEFSFTGDAPKGVVKSFDTTTVKDASGIPLCISGEYQIDAYSPATDYAGGNPAMAASPMFRISLITVEEMRNGYCFGTPLYSSDTPFPKRQPSVVTGVTFYRMSENTKKAIHALVYTAATTNPVAPATLSWSGGAAIQITNGREILPGLRGDYAEVDIDNFELPVADASEGIVIDKQDMQDDVIRGEIQKAIAEIENSTLKVFLEPYRVATEPYFSADGGFDKPLPTIMYTARDFNINGKAWKLDLPINWVQRVDLVEGYIGNTRALQITGGAFGINRKSGQLDVLPYNSQYAYLYTFFQQINFWGVREYIADFWRFKGVAGLAECPPDILKLIGYTAGITVLALAGQGYRGGFSSESNSKDGVSRSVSYTASASYGIYSATIEEYRKWVDANLPTLRNQYRGITMVVL